MQSEPESTPVDVLDDQSHEVAPPASESAAPTIGVRLLIAMVGAVLCAVGVLLGSPWVLGGGIAALFATSVVPDRSIPLPRRLAASAGGGLAGPTAALAAGSGLVGISVLGLFRRVEAGWPLVSWLIGLAVVVGAVMYHDVSSMRSQKKIWRPSVRSFDLWMLGALTVVGFVLRVRRLETLPPMHGDEGEMSMLALRVGSSSAEYLPPFTTGFLDHPTLFHYLQKLSMVIFGQSVGGVRMVSAIFGALCIPAVYAVGRLGWTRRVGLIAASIVAFSHIHIQFSRMALNNIHSVLMVTVMAAGILWSDRSLKRRDGLITPLLGTGMACGLAQYFYYGSRLLPVVLAVVMIVFVWRYRTQFSRLLLVPLGFFLTWLPLVPRYLQAPSTFDARLSGVNVFSEQNSAAIGADGTFDILVFQLKRNLRFFIDAGDQSTFYFADAPGLTALAAILFWVGLGLALAKARTFPAFTVLVWFVLGLGLGGVLTNGAPAATRLVMIYPAIAVFGGIAVDHFVGLISAKGPSAEGLRSGLLVAIAVLLAIAGVRTYFGDFADNPPRAFTDAIAREFAEQADSADTFLIGDPILFAEHGTMRFINHPYKPRNLFTATEIFDQENTKPMLFVAAVLQSEDELELLMRQIPGGEFRTVNAPTGQPSYFTYLVDH